MLRQVPESEQRSNGSQKHAIVPRREEDRDATFFAIIGPLKFSSFFTFERWFLVPRFTLSVHMEQTWVLVLPSKQDLPQRLPSRGNANSW
jgi:hypothetical protein